MPTFAVQSDARQRLAMLLGRIPTTRELAAYQRRRAELHLRLPSGGRRSAVRTISRVWS